MKNTEPEDKVTLPDLEETTVIEKIDKKDMIPLYDSEHDHIYIKDDEETEDYQAYICTRCPVGVLISKH